MQEAILLNCKNGHLLFIFAAMHLLTHLYSDLSRNTLFVAPLKVKLIALL